MPTRRALISQRILSFISVFPEQGGRTFHVERPPALLYACSSRAVMFHVERMVVCRAAALLVCVLALGSCRLRAVFRGAVLGVVGWRKGSLVCVLLVWSSSSGGALLVLSAIRVGAVDVAQSAAHRARCSWLLVLLVELTALSRSADGYPSVL